MVNDFQKGSLSTRLGIPMLYGIDAVHGHNTVYNATIFPHNIGLGATRQVTIQSFLYANTIKYQSIHDRLSIPEHCSAIWILSLCSS